MYLVVFGAVWQFCFTAVKIITRVYWHFVQPFWHSKRGQNNLANGQIVLNYLFYIITLYINDVHSYNCCIWTFNLPTGPLGAPAKSAMLCWHFRVKDTRYHEYVVFIRAWTTYMSGMVLKTSFSINVSYLPNVYNNCVLLLLFWFRIRINFILLSCNQINLILLSCNQMNLLLLLGNQHILHPVAGQPAYVHPVA